MKTFNSFDSKIVIDIYMKLFQARFLIKLELLPKITPRSIFTFETQMKTLKSYNYRTVLDIYTKLFLSCSLIKCPAFFQKLHMASEVKLNLWGQNKNFDLTQLQNCLKNYHDFFSVMFLIESQISFQMIFYLKGQTWPLVSKWKLWALITSESL